jgi:hypothetical protein
MVMADEAEEFTEALANLLPGAVRDAYREEEEALLQRDEEANERIARNTPFPLRLAEALFDPIGLFDPSNSSVADQPTDQRIVNQRVDGAIQRIESRLGFTLDDETKANIRSDVSAMWGRPIRPAD